jgi:hypothetical protein
LARRASFQGNALFSYNLNTWRNCGSILTLSILLTAGQRITVERQELKERFRAFSRAQMILEKTVQVRRLSHARLQWRFQDPQRILEFDFSAEYDRVSLSFLPPRDASKGPDLAQGAPRGQGFVAVSEGRRMLNRSHFMVARWVQDMFREQGGQRAWFRPSDCTLASKVHKGVTARSSELELVDPDAAALPFIEEQDPASVRLDFKELPLQGSLNISAGGQALEAHRDWVLCGDTLVIRNQHGAADNLVLEYLEPARPILRYPFQLEDHARPLGLQAWRLDSEGLWTPIPVNFDGQHLEFAARDFREGARVRVLYTDSLVEPSSLHIPQVFEPRSIRLSIDHERCSSRDFLLEKNYLLSQCSANIKWTLSLSYAFEMKQELIELGDEWRAMQTNAQWRVLVNGEDFNDVLKSDLKILLMGGLPPGAKATLQVSVRL